MVLNEVEKEGWHPRQWKAQIWMASGQYANTEHCTGGLQTAAMHATELRDANVNSLFFYGFRSIPLFELKLLIY